MEAAWRLHPLRVRRKHCRQCRRRTPGQDGIKHPICVIQEQGNVALEARCQGVKEKVPGTENLYVTGTDMSSVSSTVTAKLQATSMRTPVIGLAAPVTMTIVKAVASANSKAKVASFDMNAELGKAITDGTVALTVDQQPWLQGYAIREKVMGKEHVQGSLGEASDFSRAIQELATDFAWGRIWTRAGLNLRTRSLLTVAMLTALEPKP